MKSDSLQNYAFKMQLIPGNEAEYKKRHDLIWPELVELLREAGISDYSIHLDRTSGELFGVLKRPEKHRMDELPLEPIMQRWWASMADIMDTKNNNEPVVKELEQVFQLD